MYRPILTIASFIILLFASPRVNADTLRTPIRPLQLELGGEFNVGSGERTVGVRGYVGYAHVLAQVSRRWQLYAGAGLHGHIGQVYVDDRRAVDGVVTTDRRLVGPEARIGFALGPILDTYVAAGVFRAQAGTISENLAEAGTGDGYRVSLGLAYRGSWAKIVATMDEDYDDDDVGAMAILAFLVPNSIELTMEQVVGDRPRFGAGAGWAF